MLVRWTAALKIATPAMGQSAASGTSPSVPSTPHPAAAAASRSTPPIESFQWPFLQCPFPDRSSSAARLQLRDAVAPPVAELLVPYRSGSWRRKDASTCFLKRAGSIDHAGPLSCKLSLLHRRQAAKMDTPHAPARTVTPAYDDFSGIDMSAFSNPYDALIAASKDDPVRLSRPSTHCAVPPLTSLPPPRPHSLLTASKTRSSSNCAIQPTAKLAMSRRRRSYSRQILRASWSIRSCCDWMTRASSRATLTPGTASCFGRDRQRKSRRWCESARRGCEMWCPVCQFFLLLSRLCLVLRFPCLAPSMLSGCSK